MSYASFDHQDVITNDNDIPKPVEGGGDGGGGIIIPDGVPPEVVEKLKPISVSKQSKAQTNPVKPTTYSPNIELDIREVGGREGMNGNGGRDVGGRDVGGRDGREEVVIAPPTHHIPSQHIPSQPIMMHRPTAAAASKSALYDDDEDVYNVPPKDTYSDPLLYLYIPMLFAFFVVIVSIPAFSHIHIIVKASGALVFAFIVQYIIAPF
jgi:hypothetical protein